MGLDVPDLDDRPYEEIMADALKRLPVHSTDWTDHNAHDPGITILETLAWLAETYIYQLDRVTDAHRRKYLALLGVQPKPPVPATVDLQVAPAAAGPVGIPAEWEGEVIEEGETVLVDDGGEFTGVFETTKPVTLTRARIARVVTDHADGLTDNTTANETVGMRYLAFGARAAQGDALYLGFDRDPFAAAEEDIIDVTVDYDDTGLPPVTTHAADDVAFRPSVELSWQHCTDYSAWRNDEMWQEFTVIRDQTRQLYRGGTVALERTEAWQETPAAILNLDEKYFWIRCQVETPGYEIPPPIDAVRMDIVPARHRATVQGEELDRHNGGTGTTIGPGQTFTFTHTPVLEATITVGGDPWEQVPDFDASGPDDRHYVITSARDAIRFGDGRNGALPEPGRPVVAETYAYGGGAHGNVPRSSSCEFVREAYDAIPVSLRDSATGGADAETIDAAITRLRRDLGTSQRAVSLDDYRRLAKQTPGVRIGRVTAFVDRGRNATGQMEHDEVRVVVVPYSPRAEPQPSEGLLDAVQRHLVHHRLLTDRVRVEPPTFVGISVEATVSLTPGYDEQARIAAIEAALDAFLDPRGTSDDEGWPFGRSVYRSELYGVIEAVDGVDVVLDVSIGADPAGDRDGDGNVLLDDVALPSPKRHHVVVERRPSERAL